MDFFFLKIAGLSRSNNLEITVFKQHTCHLAIAARFLNFFCYFYNALDIFVQKIKFLP